MTLFDMAKQSYVSFQTRLHGPKPKTKIYIGVKLKIKKLQNLKLKTLVVFIVFLSVCLLPLYAFFFFFFFFALEIPCPVTSAIFFLSVLVSFFQCVMWRMMHCFSIWNPSSNWKLSANFFLVMTFELWNYILIVLKYYFDVIQWYLEVWKLFLFNYVMFWWKLNIVSFLNHSGHIFS